MKILKFGFMMMIVLGLSACAGSATTENPAAISDSPTVQSPETLVNSEPEPLENDEDVVLPSWFSQEQKDINSGKVFKITDFKGKVILVETMAVWCPKCLTQQKEIARLMTFLSGRDDFVSIGIDIDPNENETLLSSHVKKYGFNWIFTIGSKAIIEEIGALYGAQYLNPPATPMMIIDKRGAQHLLPFGIKTAEDLQNALQPFLDAE